MGDSTVPGFELDPATLRIVDANETFCRHLDEEAPSVVGSPLTDFYDVDPDGIRDADRACRQVQCTTRGDDDRVTIQVWQSGETLFGVVTEAGGSSSRASSRVRELHHGATEIVSADTVEQAYSRAITAAESTLGFDVCVIYTADEDAFHLAAASDADYPIPATVPRETGVLAETYRTGESTLVPSIDESDVSEPAHEQYASAISVPLADEAVFQAISTVEGYYTRRDLELAEVLALHVEDAVRNIASQRAIKATKDKIERLHAVAAELETCTTHEELYPRVVAAAEEILEFDWCVVAVVEEGWFELKAVSDDAPFAVGERHLRVDEGIAGHTFEQGTPTVVDDSQNHPIASPVDESITSSLSVPIGDVGVLEGISEEPAFFDSTDAELAELLTTHLAAAYERVEMQARLRARKRELTLLKQVQSRVLRHNIRNDLNIIMGAAETLTEPDPETAADVRETITRTGRQLLSTSEKARRIETVVDTTPDRVTVDLVDVVADLVADVREAYPEATVETDLPDSARLTAPSNVESAIREVVENGIVHDPSDPAVTVELEDADTEVVVRVSDTGPGIPDSEVAVLEQEEESALEHGTGAGLWLTKLVVYKLGGDVSFTTSGDGTTAHLHFPRTAE